MIVAIEDERHAEQQGEFATIQDAVAELRRRAQIAWDSDPNQAPCTNWKNCGRVYEVVEYDDTRHPWVEVRRTPALEVTAAGVKWLTDFEDRG